VGTEVGVFVGIRRNGAVTWSPLLLDFSSTIPGFGIGGILSTRVGELTWMTRAGFEQLIIATHGQGVLILHAPTQ
jgi:hypothetical protein